MNAPQDVTFYLNIQWQKTGFIDFIIQQFLFISSKKYYKYAFDNRYILKQKIDDIINEEVNKNGLEFVNRIDHKDMIEIVYKQNEDFKFKSFIKNVSFFLPPNTCMYCKKKEEKNGFIFCNEKKKHYQTPIKTCKIFRSINELIT